VHARSAAIGGPVALFVLVEDVFDQAFVPRLISVCGFIAVTLVFWLPLVVWKNRGHERARRIEGAWRVADFEACAARGGGPVPAWEVWLPGIARSDTVSHPLRILWYTWLIFCGSASSASLSASLRRKSRAEPKIQVQLGCQCE
jgi:hypothetical protein